MVRLIERIAHRPLRFERIRGERIAEWPAPRGRARARDSVFDQPYLDLVRAEPDAVAIAQIAHGAGADRGGFPVEKRAVERCVGELPDTAAVREGEVTLGEQSSPPVVLRVSGATLSGQRRTVIVSCMVSADCGQAGHRSIASRRFGGQPAGAAHRTITRIFQEAVQSCFPARTFPQTATIGWRCGGAGR